MQPPGALSELQDSIQTAAGAAETTWKMQGVPGSQGEPVAEEPSARFARRPVFKLGGMCSASLPLARCWERSRHLRSSCAPTGRASCSQGAAPLKQRAAGSHRAPSSSRNGGLQAAGILRGPRGGPVQRGVAAGRRQRRGGSAYRRARWAAVLPQTRGAWRGAQGHRKLAAGRQGSGALPGRHCRPPGAHRRRPEFCQGTSEVGLSLLSALCPGNFSVQACDERCSECSAQRRWGACRRLPAQGGTAAAARPPPGPAVAGCC